MIRKVNVNPITQGIYNTVKVEITWEETDCNGAWHNHYAMVKYAELDKFLAKLNKRDPNLWD